jgi:hypothetical protein
MFYNIVLSQEDFADDIFGELHLADEDQLLQVCG